MAKPILHAKCFSVDRLTEERLETLSKVIKKNVNNEYHVLVTNFFGYNLNDICIECFNDCKGLTDVDIEELIKSIK